MLRMYALDDRATYPHGVEALLPPRVKISAELSASYCLCAVGHILCRQRHIAVKAYPLIPTVRWHQQFDSTVCKAIT